MEILFEKSWTTVPLFDDEAKDAVIRELKKHANETKVSLDVIIYYMGDWQFITWKPVVKVDVKEGPRW